MDPLKDTEVRLTALCKEMRWRTRLNRALGQVGRAGTVALWILAVGLAADGLLLVSRPMTPWCALAAGLFWSGAVFRAWIQSITNVVACQRLDQQAHLEGRLANALAFLKNGASGELSAMEQAAVHDAARALSRAQPRAVEPLRPPPMSRALLGALLACVLAVGLSRTVAPMDASGVSALSLPPAPDFRVRVEERLDLLQLEADARNSEEAASRAGDPQVREWLEALNELIQDVASGRLSAERAHARIAALERAQEAWEASAGDAATVEEHLRSAGAQTSRPTKHLRSTVDALRAAQWEEGSQALDAAADNASAERSERSRRRLSQGLEALARRLSTERQRAEQRAKKERRRLKKKEKKQGRLSRRDRRRLNRRDRQLDKLERQRSEMGEMERTLERLQREMDRAAQASRRGGAGMDPEFADAMRRAAEAMKRMGQLSQGRRQMRVSKARLKELRELLRRAAQGAGKRGKAGSEGKEGKEGEDGRVRFMRLALGQGKGGQPGQGEGQGSPSVFELGPGAGSGGEQVELSAGESAESGGGAGGMEAGEGVDSQLYGEAERADVQTRSDHVSGKEGEGASQTRVVLSAARAGFVTARWKKVHQDYSQVEEEAMERQHIPAGRRQYVRQYFDLIRPR